jgi:hypothetical protein
MPGVRRAAALALLLVVAGCSSDDDEPTTPVACLQPAAGYLQALEAAPAAVRLDGTTPISDCLTRGQGSGELANVGESMVSAATQLNAGARRAPGSPASLQLGYLVAAVEKGAAETGGIHADLVRRLQTAAQFSGGRGQPPASFQRAFGRGFAAGQASG